MIFFDLPQFYEINFYFKHKQQKKNLAKNFYTYGLRKTDKINPRTDHNHTIVQTNNYTIVQTSNDTIV